MRCGNGSAISAAMTWPLTLAEDNNRAGDHVAELTKLKGIRGLALHNKCQLALKKTVSAQQIDCSQALHPTGNQDRNRPADSPGKADADPFLRGNIDG